MAGQLRVEADLTLTITPPAGGGGESASGARHRAGAETDAPLRARMTADGTEVRVELDQLQALPIGLSRRTATDVAGDVAALAADAGLTITIVGPGGPILSLGAVRGGLLERAVTGSRHIAVRDRAAAAKLLRAGLRGGRAGRGADGGARLSLTDLTPPPTLWPLAPTVTPVRRRRVRTTHDPLGGGDPRLVYYRPPGPELGAVAQVLHLRRGTTTIGSAPDNDLVVPGLEPQHAEVRRDPASDEYSLVALTAAPATVAGRQASQPLVLRTGARLECGTLRLVYVRDEYADHGRPFGGRQGGEFSRQRPQPRPRYQG